MKIVLLLAALIACSLAYNTMTHNDGHEVLMELEEGNHNVYVIMFYAGSTEGGALANRNNDYEDALIKRVLETFDDFTYTKIDARDRDYEDLVTAVGVSTSELQKSPSVLIMENGNGAWIHGPETISKISEYAPAYAARSSRQ